MEILIKSIQVALFTPSIDLSEKINLSSYFLKGSNNLFDGEPIILPLPNDAPPEIPRIILKNKEQTYTLQITTNRIDFIYEDKSADSKKNTLTELQTQYLSHLSNITKTLISEIGSKVSRLGFIPVLQYKIDNATSYIIKTYFKDSKLTQSTEEINFGILHKIKINEQPTNIWLRVNSFNKPGDKLNNKLVVLLFDINTPQELVLDLKQKDIIKYFSESLTYISKNINFYIK